VALLGRCAVAVVTIGVDGPVDLDWCSDSESSADGRAGRGPAIVVNKHIPATTAAAHSARATARLLAGSSGFGPAWRVDGGKIVSLTA